MLIAMMLIILTLLAPHTTHAQQSPPDLIVTLRDAQNQGVAGVTISVRDAADGQEIGRATTDTQGHAVFPVLPVGDIRVVVQGRLTNGSALYLPGLDAQGIRLTLGAPPTWLDLRSEPDGLIRPDPATMIVPERGAELAQTAGPIAADWPEAPIATPPLTTVRLFPPVPASDAFGRLPTPVVSTASDTTVMPPVWLSRLALALLLLSGVGLLWLVRKEWRYHR
jgi:hypothetical protein